MSVAWAMLQGAVAITSAGRFWSCGPLGMGTLFHGGRLEGEMRDNAEVARRHRLRAEELRTIAEGMQDEGTRKILLRLADDYEQWARAAEETDRVNKRLGRFSISN